MAVILAFHQEAPLCPCLHSRYFGVKSLSKEAYGPAQSAHLTLPQREMNEMSLKTAWTNILSSAPSCGLRWTQQQGVDGTVKPNVFLYTVLKMLIWFGTCFHSFTFIPLRSIACKGRLY